MELRRYEDMIRFLPSGPLSKEELCTGRFQVGQEGALDVYYAPHNDYLNEQARVVIVGITPGWQQMRIAFETARDALSQGESVEAAARQAKFAASFAGVMRTNMTAMLDACGLPEALGIPSSASLFDENRNLLHTTSILRHPVFHSGKNYTGHQPPIDRSALLCRYAYTDFPDELTQISEQAIVVPLGKTVSSVLQTLEERDLLPNHTYLHGFPHPSGANGHRHKQFEVARSRMTEQIARHAW
ncbi:hypothetical protein [Exiguobacterium flavidum]|uniref:hypothetical protein n=1 Tax=Exiguobacterium flavidum TaxID=2184695 RepID=UPI000DF7D441|nr:hypothetical protein [Exiguobacterium flavidum]